jgi:hypothetical protein
MFILPQTIKPLELTSKKSVSNLTDMYFLVTCRILNVADTENGVDFDNDTYLYGSKTECAEILIPVSAAANTTAWEAGKKYVYTFIFGRNGGNGGYDPLNPDPDDPVLNTITYTTETITVDDWSIVTPEYEVEMTTKK